MKVKGICVNDMHFGIRDSKRLYDESEQIFEYLEKHEDVQIVIIDGDLFDGKVSLTDAPAYYAMSFVHRIIETMKKRGGCVRLVQGTRSHDLNQLQIFRPFITNTIDKDCPEITGFGFDIVDHVREEKLLNCLPVLFIPEEYPENADEYYKEFKAEDKKYAAIFGHGTWDFVALQSQIEHGNRTDIFTAPVFFWKEWKHTVENGFISFGHIHGRNVYKKKIYYSGSFSRWGYGERSDKGFTAWDYDTMSGEYHVEFVDNIKAPRYDVFAARDIEVEDFTKLSALELQTIFDEKLSHTDNLRIDLGGLNEDVIHVLRKYYEEKNNVKIEVRTGRKAILKESEDEELSKEFEKYSYITKSKLPIDEMIKRFCKEELGVDLELDTIKGILKEEDEE